MKKNNKKLKFESRVIYEGDTDVFDEISETKARRDFGHKNVSALIRNIDKYGGVVTFALNDGYEDTDELRITRIS